MFFTSFSISHRFILACHFLAFVFCLNCCNLPYCHIFSNLVFFTDIFIFHYVTYVCLLRLMPLCKTCFDCIFIPLHLTKWAVAHESLCSIIKIVNFSAQCSVFLNNQIVRAVFHPKNRQVETYSNRILFE